MFKRILVPLDGSHRSERALSLAARIARATHGSLLLLRVIEPESTQPTLPVSDLHDAYAYLHKQREQLPPEVDVQCIAVTGEVVPSILSQAKEHAVDLIVLCSRGQTGIKGLVLRSVTQVLAAQGTVPLLILREESPVPQSPYPDPARPLHTIEALVALDGSAQAARAVIPAVYLVAALAAPVRGVVHLLEILPKATVGESGEVVRDEAGRQKVEQARHYLQQKVSKLNHGLGAKLSVEVVGSLIEENDVRAGIVRAAEQGIYLLLGGSEFIVMVTHRRESVGAWVSESVTEYVMEKTSLPLLIVPEKHIPQV
ncbi:MAG: universal stress protein [Ktedonobacteraceae bacterium]|nr:universal stress protein [Ktedonobacteraceae bacterium]